MKYLVGLSLLLAMNCTLVLADEPTTSKTDVVVLYDGGDLTGWVGRDDLWTAEEGQIVGRTSDENPIDGNTFLIWDGEKPASFELTAEFKIESGNSGIQYRSKVVDDDKFVVSGYQADIDFTNKFAGILYEEKGRGILAQRGESVTIGSDGEKTRKRFGESEALAKGIHPGQWNEFRVVADGNHLQHFINGTMTAEVIDEQSDKAAKDGVIALQIHRGPAMTVRFKNIKLRKLN
ncbi:MAG: 3-keto-disaccharide hydrolase [Rubripirellula sp.]